jgi:tetratricopeptide (TPR) repeat protein
LKGIDSKYWAIAFIVVSLILFWVAASLLMMVMGDLAAVEGKYPRAVCLYSWAEKLHWRSARLYTNRGNLRYRLGDLERAAQDFGRSIQLQAKQAEAYWGRGTILMSQGQNEAALADYDLGLSHRQNSAQAHCSRGILRQRRSDRSGAIEDFERAIELQPDFFYPHYYLGALLAETDHPTALAHVQRAIELRPQYPPLYYLQAYLQFAAVSGEQNGDAAAVKESLQLAQDWEGQAGGDRYLKDEYGYFYRAWAMKHLEQPEAQQDREIARELATCYDNQMLLASLKA